MIVEKPWSFGEEQVITIQGKVYNVSAAIFEAREIEVVEVPISQIYMSYGSPCSDSLRDFIAHMMLVNDANTDYPIIMNQDGAIIDGKHRLAKAILRGDEFIKVQRFIKDPTQIYQYK